MHGLVIVQSLLVNVVVRNIATLKVELKSSPTAFKRCTLSSVISSWRILHTMSAVRSEDTVERFRTGVGMKRNYVANKWTKSRRGD